MDFVATNEFERLCKQKNITMFYNRPILEGEIYQYSYLTRVESYARAGANNLLNIGAFSYIVSGDENLFRCKIGRFSSIARMVSIAEGHHPIDRLSSSPYTYGDFELNDINEEFRYAGKKLAFDPHYGIAEIGNDVWIGQSVIIKSGSAHDKKIKKSDKTRHNSNFFDELNHAKSYQT